MSPEVQQIAALVLVALAAVSVAWRAWRARFSGKSGGSCPGCGECGRPPADRPAPKATPLVTLTASGAPRPKPPTSDH
jgi:hypothetical protein